MDRERKATVRLGAFVAVGVGVMLLGMAFIGRKRNLFTNTFTIQVLFHDVGGLQVGNRVRYAGVNVGSVKQLAFLDARSIQVSLDVDRKILPFLTTAAVATVSTEGVIGSKLLVLAEPGTGGRPLRDQDRIQGYPPPSIDELYAQVKGSVTDLRGITQDIAAISHQIRTGQGTVGRVFMDPRLARKVEQSVENFQAGAKGFKELMDDAKHSWVLWGFGKTKGKEKGKSDQ